MDDKDKKIEYNDKKIEYNDKKIDYNKYNHISIFMFLVPLIQSSILECNRFIIINTIWLVFGFMYHYSLYKSNYQAIYVRIFRVLDITAVHTLIPYIIYKSCFNNMYFYFGILCVKLLIILFYLCPKLYIPHIIIHIIAGSGVWCSVNSCYLNKELCDLC
jgi:hypothetical protein